MPEHEHYIYIDTAHVNTWDSSSNVSQMYEEWLHECEEADRVMEQKMREAEEQCYQEMLRQEEMNKYPLFFWREMCKKEKK